MDALYTNREGLQKDLIDTGVILKSFSYRHETGLEANITIKARGK